MGTIFSVLSSAISSIWGSIFKKDVKIEQWPVELNYPIRPPKGKKNGRYIGMEPKDDVDDESAPRVVQMHNARQLCKPASLENQGFELVTQHSKVKNFRNDDEVVKTYYPEIIELVKNATGASKVIVFDHTVRQSSMTTKNVLKSKNAAASPVPRIHCDYTHEGAPKRLLQLAQGGSYTTKDLFQPGEVEELLKKRFTFINCWRSIDGENKIEQKPLTVCDWNSVNMGDSFIYHLIYENRVGLNYSLDFKPTQNWYYYPFMEKEECLLFKVYESDSRRPRFVFHTAFDEPHQIDNPKERQSIECRTIAFFD